MLYDSDTSGQGGSQEIDFLRSVLSVLDGSYTWTQIKKILQEQVFPIVRNLVLGPPIERE